ncbi:MAG: DnaJ domain-containing protein [Candidatus Brocadiales bacterium]|nr:DnaJ domain-containing protein [Candidatus Brocadiales bacterium]
MFGGESVVAEVAGVVILYTFKYGFMLSGVYNLVVPFVFNRSTPILAFCVMVSRQLLVVIAPFLMIFVMIFGYGAIQRKGESNNIFAFRNELAKFRALAIFSAVAFFMLKLINGDRVRDSYGFRPKNQRRRKRKDDYSYASGNEKNDNQFDSHDDSEFDPCEILGISRTDSTDVNKVKEAYHNLSRKYHPDKVMHLGEKFRELATNEMKTINEAYRILVKDESAIQNITENDNPKSTSNINHPDIGPGLFDVTVEAWLFRISKWGKLNFRYQEPGTLRKKTITRAKFEMLLTNEGLIRALGGWTNDWIAVNKLEIFRTYQNVEGKKVTERLFVTIDLNPEIKEALR